MDSNDLLNQIAQMLEQQTHHMDEQIRRVELKIENDVTKRLDALTDGYKLNHEKQFELERRLEALERRLERLEIAG